MKRGVFLEGDLHNDIIVYWYMTARGIPDFGVYGDIPGLGVYCAV